MLNLKSLFYVTICFFMIACSENSENSDLVSSGSSKASPTPAAPSPSLQNETEETEETETIVEPPQVELGELSHFVVSGISSNTDIGVSENVVVKAYDVHGNIKTDYTGTITFSSDDSMIDLPLNYQFLVQDNGQKNFTGQITFGSVGNYFVKVQDTVDNLKVGEQSNIVVTDTMCSDRTIQFSNISTTATEGNSNHSIGVQLSSACANPVSVNYSTAGGSANSGSDFNGSSGVVNFPAGTIFALIDLSLIDDGDIESTEEFSISLSNPTKNTTLGTSLHTFYIQDDDTAPVCPDMAVGFSTSSSNFDEDQTGTSVEIVSSATCPVDVSFNYSMVNQEAYAGDDYVLSTGTLVLPAGETSVSLNVDLIDDTESEQTETFKIQISGVGPLNASPGLSIHTVLINDNDGGPPPCTATVGFELSNSLALESVTDRNISVVLSEVCSADLNINYATSDISAETASDYTQSLGQITIPAGELSTNISLSINDDGLVESDESFSVNLLNSSMPEVNIGTSVHTVVIVDNDSSSNFYYVRKSGSDTSGDGTSPETAWATIGKAAQESSPGDTIFIGAGTYTEGLFPNSGTVDEPITYIGDTQGINTGDAGEVILSNPGNYGVTITNKSNVIFDRISFKNSSMGFYGSFGSTSNISVRNCKFESLNHGIVIFQIDGFYIEHNEFNGLGSIGVLAYSNSKNLKIKNNLFHSGYYGVYLGANVPNTIIENNTFYNNSVVHIYLYSNVTATIRNNIITDGLRGIWDATSSSTLTLSHNNVWNNSMNYINTSAGIGSIAVDPKYVNPGVNFRVDPISETIDAGSTNANNIIFYDGSNLSGRETRADGVNDGSAGLGDGAVVNMGYHY